MVRDDLYIAVPSFFRCPISLDVMKSPVSLCTGVTYDRSSIQRWLDDGNNTCPATMQVLQTKEFIPNLTLQKIIQIWTDSVRHRVDSADSPVAKSVPSKNQVIAAIRALESQSEKSENRFRCVTEILCFAEQSQENCEFLSRTERLLPLLVGFLDNVNVDGGEFLERVIQILDLILNKSDRYIEALRNSVLKNNKSVLLVLQKGSSDSKIASARVLQFIAADVESKLLIGENDGVLLELVNLIAPGNDDAAVIESGLSCLIALSTPKRNKTKLVNLGVVKTLSSILSESKWSVSVTEKALKLLETVSSSKEGRSAICEDPNCLAAILQKVLKVSATATETAVTVLWSVLYPFRDQKAQESVTKANGLTKILLLMQSNCSPGVRQMCADLLKIFRVNSKSCLSCYHTETTHIMPF